MTVQQVRIIKGGKRVIPAPMRHEMRIATGDTALVEIKDGELRLRKPSCGAMCPKACSWRTN